MSLSPEAHSKARSRFERIADRYNQRAEERAEQWAKTMDQPPAEGRPATRDELRRMWDFSPFPNPEERFWQVRDEVYQKALGDIPPDADVDQAAEAAKAAHADAEAQAMQQVYPERWKLLGAGRRHYESQIAVAKRLRRLATGEDEPPAGTVPEDQAERPTPAEGQA